jgi:hypothetical protein
MNMKTEKFYISTVFSVTPNVGILFRHPLYFSTAPSDGLFRQLFLQCDILEHRDVKQVQCRSYCCCLSCIYFSTNQPNTTGCYSLQLVVMKQIFDVEEKPFTSSINAVQKHAVEKGGFGVQRLLTTTLFPSWSVDISVKDDVFVIFLLVVSFMLVIKKEERLVNYSSLTF